MYQEYRQVGDVPEYRHVGGVQVDEIFANYKQVDVLAIHTNG